MSVEDKKRRKESEGEKTRGRERESGGRKRGNPCDYKDINEIRVVKLMACF